MEITSTRPVVPTIKKLDAPPRLVIDLPNANMSERRKRIDVSTEEISAVRLNQYQTAPPIVRVVVDLLKPSGYSTDAAGNRLTIRLRPAEDASAKKAPAPPAVPAPAPGVQPAAIPASHRKSGAVVLGGTRVATGSSITAGSDTAVLRLPRGGEVRVCPGTKVSVTSSPSGRDLMLGLNTGALEADYTLEASADSILTPDFRILLAGPGEFHYAISVDSRGNTCVRTLPGNTASAIVSELMGDGTYQVKPTEQIVFHSGHLNAMDTAVPASCGCPPPAPPVMTAAAPPAPVVPEANLPATSHLAPLWEEVKPAPPPVSASGLKPSGAPPAQVTVSVTGPEIAALPTSQPNDVHVQVDAPFVFRAADPEPPPIREAQRLSPTTLTSPVPLETIVLPPPPAPPAPAEMKANRPRRGFFRKLGRFFAAMFR